MGHSVLQQPVQAAPCLLRLFGFPIFTPTHATACLVSEVQFSLSQILCTGESSLFPIGHERSGHIASSSHVLVGHPTFGLHNKAFLANT